MRIVVFSEVHASCFPHTRRNNGNVLPIAASWSKQTFSILFFYQCWIIYWPLSFIYQRWYVHVYAWEYTKSNIIRRAKNVFGCMSTASVWLTFKPFLWLFNPGWENVTVMSCKILLWSNHDLGETWSWSYRDDGVVARFLYDGRIITFSMFLYNVNGICVNFSWNICCHIPLSDTFDWTQKKNSLQAAEQVKLSEDDSRKV